MATFVIPQDIGLKLEAIHSALAFERDAETGFFRAVVIDNQSGARYAKTALFGSREETLLPAIAAAHAAGVPMNHAEQTQAFAKTRAEAARLKTEKELADLKLAETQAELDKLRARLDAANKPVPQAIDENEETKADDAAESELATGQPARQGGRRRN